MSVVSLVTISNIPQNQTNKMKSFIALTFLTACLFATAWGAYDCPELAKDFYGNDIVCGYGLASDWKTCGKSKNIFAGVLFSEQILAKPKLR